MVLDVMVLGIYARSRIFAVTWRHSCPARSGHVRRSPLYPQPHSIHP
jgi:hypothetical protein